MRRDARACRGRNRRRGAPAGCRQRRHRCGGRPADPWYSRRAAGSGKVDLGLGGDQVPGALLADLKPVDLLEAARAVGEEALPRLCFGGAGERAFLLPRPAVRLHRHIVQRIDPVLRAELDLVDQPVAGTLPFPVHMSGTVEVAVQRTVELRRVGFEPMRAELPDIKGDGLRQALKYRARTPGLFVDPTRCAGPAGTAAAAPSPTCCNGSTSWRSARCAMSSRLPGSTARW
jgi:hypothetical protein